MEYLSYSSPSVMTMLPRAIVSLLTTTCIPPPRMINVGSAVVNSLLLAFATNNSNGFSTFRNKQPTSITITAPIINNIMTDERMVAGSNGDIISRLRSLGMDKKELKRHARLRRASILVPLFERSHHSNSNNNDASPSSSSSSNIHVLFTQRLSNMTSHAGEVCFPGGMQDTEDCQDDVQTALREAYEEVGLENQYIDCIARMNTVESKHSLCVTPIIGWIHPPSKAEPSELQLNAEEVDIAFAVPLQYFANPTNCHSIDMYKWKGGNVEIRTYLYDDPESGRQFKIWGLTAHVVHKVAQLAFGGGEIKT